MAVDVLHLNPQKTEILLIGEYDINPKITGKLCFLFYSNLSLTSYIYSVAQSCFYQFRSISKIKPFLPNISLVSVFHAFISYDLDYCDTIFFVA